MLRVPRQDSEFELALRSMDSPDAPGQRPFVSQPAQIRLVAPVGQLETNWTLADAADESSPYTEPPGRIEEHRRVCALESKVECRVVVAVENPPVTGNQVALRLAPLGLRRLHPARLPEVKVEVDDRKAGLGRKRSREGALAGSGHASDHDASPDGNPGRDVPYGSIHRKTVIRHKRILPDTGWMTRSPAYPAARGGSGGYPYVRLLLIFAVGMPNIEAAGLCKRIESFHCLRW